MSLNRNPWARIHKFFPLYKNVCDLCSLHSVYHQELNIQVRTEAELD